MTYDFIKSCIFLVTRSVEVSDSENKTYALPPPPMLERRSSASVYKFKIIRT